MAAEFARKNIRPPASRYRGRGLYFVTLCFERRRRLAANPRTASWLVVQLREYAVRAGFFVHAYCIMPDHLPVLAAGSACGNLDITTTFSARAMQRIVWPVTSG